MTEPGSPPPVVLRIKLRYEDVDTLVQRFAPNVGKAGLFLPTKSIHPVGTEIKFEIRLSVGDAPVIVGLGRVKNMRDPDPENNRAAFGIGVELMRVTRESRELILKMLERRRAMGIADVAVPNADDIDAARRMASDETGVRDIGTGPTPKTTVDAESGPVAEPPPSEPVRRKTPTSIPVAKAPVPVPPLPPAIADVAREQSGSFSAPIPDVLQEPSSSGARARDSLLTAPRRPSRPSGQVMPIVVAAAPVEPIVTPPSSPIRQIETRSGPVVAPLAPEPSRKVRRSLGDLIASVSAAPTGNMFAETDDKVDVQSVLARARTLAGSTDLDSELEALRDSAAAPTAEITIEAASADLARRLGGLPVERKPRARTAWAPPPPSAPAAAVTEIDPPPAVSTDTAASTKSAAAMVLSALAKERVVPEADAAAVKGDDLVEDPPKPEPPVEAAPQADPPVEAPVADLELPQAAPTLDPDESAAARGDDVDDPREATVAVSPDARIYAALAAEDREDEPILAIPSSDQVITEPSQDSVDEPGDRAGLLIDDDVDPSMFEQDQHAHAELDLDAATLDPDIDTQTPQPYEAPEHLDDDDDLDPAQFAMSTSISPYQREEQVLSDRLDQALADAENDNEEDFGFGGGEAAPNVDGDGDAEEIDDFEILAESDLEDDDLALDDPRPPTGSDFVNRLELSNEFSAAPDDPLAGFRDSVVSFGDDRQPAYRAPSDPLAGFNDESNPDAQPVWDPQTGSYTYAQHPRPTREESEFDVPSTGFGGARAFDESLPREPQTADPDLENALEALDVDLDDLSGGHEPVPAKPRTRAVSNRPRNRPRIPQRPDSEADGIVIDFDDEDK